MGLHRAGFDVTGIDIKAQPRYPFRFIQADALEPPVPLEDFDLIWASPPCQAFTVSQTRPAPQHQKTHPDLIAPARTLLETAMTPFVIENVPGAPLRHGVMLCGGSFGLGARCEDGLWRSLRRHRYFETSWMMFSPPCQCDGTEKIGVYGNGGGWADRRDPNRLGYKGNVAEARQALDMSWAVTKELCQAIPPAYSEFIGLAAVRNGMDRAA